MTDSNAANRPLHLSSALYAAIVVAFCLWVLSLPLFPTQDGPMHRYYIHVLDALVQHRPLYGMYEIRHPFPPYATHYATVLLLSRLVPYDLAEKVFICLAIVCFAGGLRLCARACGPAGAWLSLLVAPLLLPWALLMGFFNFYLATGLCLIAVALWQRAGEGRPQLWAAFAGVVLVLTFTHPVPLLLLLAVCSLDLLLRSVRGSEHGWARAHRWQVAALVLLAAAFAFPASLLDKQHVHAAFEGFGIHRQFLTTTALLMGVSPYNTRATSLWINAYRISLYLLLFFWLVLGLRSRRGKGLGTTFLLATALLGVALLFLPNSINGSLYFATRLVPMLWIGLLMAASSGSAPATAHHRWLVAGAAAVLTAVSLVPADLFLRPIAGDLRAEEMQPLPSEQTGLLLIGWGLQDYVRFHRQVAFNPYQWGTALAAVSHDDTLLDSPWTDQPITPLRAKPGSLLMIDDITDSPFNKENPPAARGRSLPASKEQKVVAGSQFVLYAAAPDELDKGLSVQFDREEASDFECERRGWYLVCLRGAQP